MKVKTSVTLSQELLEAIDRTSVPRESRSEFIERVTWRAIAAAEAIASRREHEIAVLNAIADGTLGERPDVLGYNDWRSLGDDFEDSDFADSPR